MLGCGRGEAPMGFGDELGESLTDALVVGDMFAACVCSSLAPACAACPRGPSAPRTGLVLENLVFDLRFENDHRVFSNGVHHQK